MINLAVIRAIRWFALCRSPKSRHGFKRDSSHHQLIARWIRAGTRRLSTRARAWMACANAAQHDMLNAFHWAKDDSGPPAAKQVVAARTLCASFWRSPYPTLPPTRVSLNRAHLRASQGMFCPMSTFPCNLGINSESPRTLNRGYFADLRPAAARTFFFRFWASRNPSMRRKCLRQNGFLAFPISGIVAANLSVCS